MRPIDVGSPALMLIDDVSAQVLRAILELTALQYR
jgi:hypothetical protein